MIRTSQDLEADLYLAQQLAAMSEQEIQELRYFHHLNPDIAPEQDCTGWLLPLHINQFEMRRRNYGQR